jgi:hypothetical protein
MDDKAARRAARERIVAYHQEQLRALLERVRDGFARLGAGEFDARHAARVPDDVLWLGPHGKADKRLLGFRYGA